MQVEGIVLRSMAVVLSHLDNNDVYKDYGAGWLTLETLRECSQSKEQVKILNIRLRMQIENRQGCVV